MAGSEDDAPDGFDLADDAGHGGSGQDPVLPNHQAPDLREEEQSKALSGHIPTPNSGST